MVSDGVGDHNNDGADGDSDDVYNDDGGKLTQTLSHNTAHRTKGRKRCTDDVVDAEWVRGVEAVHQIFLPAHHAHWKPATKSLAIHHHVSLLVVVRECRSEGVRWWVVREGEVVGV